MNIRICRIYGVISSQSRSLRWRDSGGREACERALCGVMHMLRTWVYFLSSSLGNDERYRPGMTSTTDFFSSIVFLICCGVEILIYYIYLRRSEFILDVWINFGSNGGKIVIPARFIRGKSRK
jgi:hypothetical protein